MPDISLLVEIAEYFDVSIPEIINGERKSLLNKIQRKNKSFELDNLPKAIQMIIAAVGAFIGAALVSFLLRFIGL